MINKQKIKKVAGQRRQIRTRVRIAESAGRPRLSVHKTLKHIYAQIIDDVSRKTLVSARDTEIKDAGKMKGVEAGQAVGKLIAEKAKAAKITQVVFDKGKFKYHGRVKAVADGAREGGLDF